MPGIPVKASMSILGLAQAYAASYSSLGKLYRLNFIASAATGALQLEAMRLAVDELRKVILVAYYSCKAAWARSSFVQELLFRQSAEQGPWAALLATSCSWL